MCSGAGLPGPFFVLFFTGFWADPYGHNYRSPYLWLWLGSDNGESWQELRGPEPSSVKSSAPRSCCRWWLPLTGGNPFLKAASCNDWWLLGCSNHSTPFPLAQHCHFTVTDPRLPCCSLGFPGTLTTPLSWYISTYHPTKCPSSRFVSCLEPD
jgi:hypothetical protein